MLLLLWKVQGDNAVDRIWRNMLSAYPTADIIEMHFPVDEKSTIMAAINPDAHTYWRTDYLFFDQYSLEEVPVGHLWSRFAEATAADKLMRLNYDIHVGAILGLPGKVLAFCVSLLVASLPVPGVLVWWGRRRKGKAGVNAAAKGAGRRKRLA